MSHEQTVADTSFAGAGQKNGLEIWRIENKEPVAVPAIEVKRLGGRKCPLLLWPIVVVFSVHWNAVAVTYECLSECKRQRDSVR